MTSSLGLHMNETSVRYTIVNCPTFPHHKDINPVSPSHGVNPKVMAEVGVSVVVAVSVVLVVSLWWRAVCWVWLKPKKLEQCLRDQGLKGPSYKFLYGNMPDLVASFKESRSKPMELSHKIQPRVVSFYHQSVEKYGKVCFTWFGPIPRVITTDPDMIRDVLSNKFGHFGKLRSNPYGKLLATGLVAYEGEKWAKHRRIINPAFHIEKLKMMLPAFNTSCSEMVNKWQKLVAEESCELDVWPHLQNLTADVISRTAFGSSYEEGRRIFQLQTEQAEHLIMASQAVYIRGFQYIPTKRTNRMKAINKEVCMLLRNIINKREKAMKTGEAPNDDLLGMLMESNKKEIEDSGNSKKSGMSIDEVIEECKLFYFAGQETTSTLLVWTMIVLSMHQDWQEKAREEVLQVFEKRTPDFEGLHHLKIVTMILHEVLRLYAPFPLLMRTTYKTMRLGKITLPPGVQIVMPPLLVHHDPELWGEDVEEFKPERFSEGVSKATKNQVSFFPFGWGPRICIGQNFALTEAKMALSMILQRFKFELSPTYTHAPCSGITLQPQHGAQLILHKI